MAFINIKNSLTFCLLLIVTITFGQEEQTYPTMKWGGLAVGRYVVSATDQVDVDGYHHFDDNYVNNEFFMKYMRLRMKAKASEKIEVNLLANLADFKHNPKKKVLENAFIRYHLSPNFKVVAGQFRPRFGFESTYPADVQKNLEWTNSYGDFGRLGWTSFQIGAGIQAKITINELPIEYAFSIINGNGKNQLSDNDNGKHFISRVGVLLDEKHKLKLSAFGGLGKDQEENTHAYGFDIVGETNLSETLKLLVEAEAKQAINHNLFFTLDEATRGNIENYKIQALYITPYFMQEITSENISAIEFSVRYEHLDHDYKKDSNPHQTITPLLGAILVEKYGARIQTGIEIDSYKHNIEGSAQHDATRPFLQAQVHF